MNKALLAIAGGLLAAGLRAAAPAPQVLIDPGHGGTDAGVVVGFFREADYALALGKALVKQLKAAGIESALTRDSDQSLSLSARVEAANRLLPQAMISLHVNASYQQGASGPRIFVPSDGAVDDALAPLWEQASRLHAKESRALGEAVARSLGATSGRPVQVLKMGLFRGNLVPTCVVELGFATDKAALRGFQDDAQRQATAQRLAHGLSNFLAGGSHASP